MIASIRSLFVPKNKVVPRRSISEVQILIERLQRKSSSYVFRNCRNYPNNCSGGDLLSYSLYRYKKVWVSPYSIHATQYSVNLNTVLDYLQRINEGFAPPVKIQEFALGKYEIIDGHHRTFLYRILDVEVMPALLYRKKSP